MRKQLDYKVEKGKLVRIDADIENDLITWIKITGDFFIYPETAILELDKLITNTRIGDVQSKLQSYILENDINIIGFSASDVSYMLTEMKK